MCVVPAGETKTGSDLLDGSARRCSKRAVMLLAACFHVYSLEGLSPNGQWSLSRGRYQGKQSICCIHLCHSQHLNCENTCVCVSVCECVYAHLYIRILNRLPGCGNSKGWKTLPLNLPILLNGFTDTVIYSVFFLFHSF